MTTLSSILNITVPSSSSLAFKDYTSLLISIAALTISIISLIRSLKNAKKNINLSIQQAIFKIAVEKAKDCNVIWDNVVRKNQEVYGENWRQSKLLCEDAISELAISKEIIIRSFALFNSNDSSNISDMIHYSYTFWKLLKTDLRGFFTKNALEIAVINKYEIYGGQLWDVYNFVKDHMESKPDSNLISSLETIVTAYRAKQKNEN